MKNICILGLGYIAHRVAMGIQYAENADLYAVASRDIQKAKTFAEAHRASAYYGSYEGMLKDDQIDIVYICTPNVLHKEHILMCLHAGKHVICEKPMVLNRIELKECFDCAKEKNLFLMEAHKTVFTPLNTILRKKINEGIIGKVHRIEAQYTSDILLHDTDPSDWHYQDVGGGCLYDIGVYPLAYANFIAQSRIQDIQIMTDKKDGRFTQFVQANLRYENGIMAHIASSWNCLMENGAVVYGEKGKIVYPNFWKNDFAKIIFRDHEEELIVDMKSDFTGEIEHAVSCIEQGQIESPIMGRFGSEEILKVIEKGECKD